MNQESTHFICTNDEEATVERSRGTEAKRSPMKPNGMSTKEATTTPTGGRCGICGSCGGMPPWAPEALAGASPAARLAVEQRLENARRRFVRNRDAFLATEDDFSGGLTPQGSEVSGGALEACSTDLSPALETASSLPPIVEARGSETGWVRENGRYTSESSHERTSNGDTDVPLPPLELQRPDADPGARLKLNMRPSSTYRDEGEATLENLQLDDRFHGATSPHFRRSPQERLKSSVVDDSAITTKPTSSGAANHGVRLKIHLAGVEKAGDMDNVLLRDTDSDADSYHTADEDHLSHEDAQVVEAGEDHTQANDIADLGAQYSNWDPFPEGGDMTGEATDLAQVTGPGMKDDMFSPMPSFQWSEALDSLSSRGGNEGGETVSLRGRATEGVISSPRSAQHINGARVQKGKLQFPAATNSGSLGTGSGASMSLSDNLEESVYSRRAPMRPRAVPSTVYPDSPGLQDNFEIAPEVVSLSSDVAFSERSNGNSFGKALPHCQECHLMRKRVTELELTVEALNSALAAQSMECAKYRAKASGGGHSPGKASARLAEELRSSRVTIEFLVRIWLEHAFFSFSVRFGRRPC